MNQRIIRIIAIVIILISCFVSGFSAGYIIKMLPETVGKINISSESSLLPKLLSVTEQGTGMKRQQNTDELFKPFWETWDLVHQYYVDQPVDDNSLMEGAIRGMLESLGDPHTRYSDPESYKQESQYIAGEEYEGIGAWVDVSGDYVEITSPMKGSPAEKAGLKPHDLVIAIDGVDMTGVDPKDALNKILGPKGSTVILTIKRDDQEPFDVSIVRDAVVTPMVASEMRDDGIAYIQLTQFGDLTVEELQQALDELLPQNPKGLILDLRNNGGGYVDTCVSVASKFLPKDSLVLIEEAGDGSRTEYHTKEDPVVDPDLPIVVLGNEGTASASEILIGALQYYHRATFVGVQTFGKGSMQIQPELSNGGAVSITIAHWLTPAGKLIHKVGITPDVVVEMSDADVEAGKDPQLDAAAQILLTGKNPGRAVVPQKNTEENGETGL